MLLLNLLKINSSQKLFTLFISLLWCSYLVAKSTGHTMIFLLGLLLFYHPKTKKHDTYSIFVQITIYTTIQLQYIYTTIIHVSYSDIQVQKDFNVHLFLQSYSFFAVAFGQPRWAVSDLLIHPFSIKLSIHCMILTCSWTDFWDEQPGDIQPDFLFPRASFSL